MKKTLIRLSICGALAALGAGCSGDTGPPTPKTIVNPSSSVAQIAVGTVNLFGDNLAVAKTGMNVTSTLRTPQGKSVLVNTPFIAGPMKLPAATGVPDGNGSTAETGPTPQEVATETISATPQQPAGAVNIPPSTFGVSGGDFANGFLPQNAGNAGNAAFDPYVQPLYDPLNATSAGDPNSFSPWGGPPAFDPNHDGQGVRDGTFGPGLLGVTEGINVFEGVTVNAGIYTLRVQIPSTTTTYTVNAAPFSLGAVTLLPAATAPTFVPNGNGGGTFAVTMPAGASDGFLQIFDLGLGPSTGNCNSAPAYYTIHVTTSGTYTLPDTDGPGNPTHRHPTICTAAQNGGSAADSITVQLIAADYPLYADQYLFNLTQQAPSIVGGGGSNDLTISSLSMQTGLRTGGPYVKVHSSHFRPWHK